MPMLEIRATIKKYDYNTGGYEYEVRFYWLR